MTPVVPRPVEVIRVLFPSGGGTCEGDLYLPHAAPEAGPEERREERREARPEERPEARPEAGPASGRASTPASGSASAPGPPPVVVMAHGIGAERAFGLDRFARRFAARGLAVLTFDYRHFGGSSGTPRHLVVPARQREDYRAALAFVRGDPRVDARRIALWGTSFSGGHVLAVAADAPAGLQAVVSQIPFVSGMASTLAYPFRYQLPATVLGVVDAMRGALGVSPLTVPVVRERGLALLASPDSRDGYLGMVPEHSGWTGRVPARVFLEVLRYHPGLRAHRIAVPVLVVGAEKDAICPIGATRRMVRWLPDGEFHALPMGHFDPYQGAWFERVVDLETGFLERHLLDEDRQEPDRQHQGSLHPDRHAPDPQGKERQDPDPHDPDPQHQGPKDQHHLELEQDGG